jgi:hypothetical protein
VGPFGVEVEKLDRIKFVVVFGGSNWVVLGKLVHFIGLSLC